MPIKTTITKIITKKTVCFFSLITVILFLSQCGLYKKSDARKVPTNANDRVKRNVEEGKRMTLGSLGLSGGTGKFEFATSNEMWRATIDILDFVPLNNADYGGGIIITDWYNNSSEDNSSIKIMVQFLSNEIRADGLKITVYKKNCSEVNTALNCNTNMGSGEISQELKLAILKKAARLKTVSVKKEREKFRKKRAGVPGVKKVGE